MILDSTFLVDVLRGDAQVSDRLAAIDEAGTPFVSAVTVMELAEGIHLADSSAAERQAVEDLLADLNELPFDRACAMRAGRLSADLVSSGGPIDEANVMIAATALVYDQAVVSRNRSHFDRVGDLEVNSY